MQFCFINLKFNAVEGDCCTYFCILIDRIQYDSEIYILSVSHTTPISLSISIYNFFYRVNENTGTTTIQKVVFDENTTINSAELLKSGSVCVIFTHPATINSSHQPATLTSEQLQQQQPPPITQKVSVNPVARDISSSGSVMTGYLLIFFILTEYE